MRLQRFAGAHSAIQHVIPFRRVVERTEHNAADQLKIEFGQRLFQYHRVLGHEPHRTKLNALVTRLSTLFQNGAPCRVARVVRKFDAPGTWRIANQNGHVGFLIRGKRFASARYPPIPVRHVSIE